MAIRSTRKAGFTLIELMIVVGIIGVLVAVAIPNFISYQARSRRSEAFVNLAAIARSQLAYAAETGEYFEAAPFPDFSSNGLGTTKMDWDAASDAAYAALGWKPEGDVFYSYESNTGATACTCTLCFTATAYGDVDGNGKVSAMMYVEPQRGSDNAILGECRSGMDGALDFGPPTRLGSATGVYNEVAVQRITDEY